MTDARLRQLECRYQDQAAYLLARARQPARWYALLVIASTSLGLVGCSAPADRNLADPKPAEARPVESRTGDDVFDEFRRQLQEREAPRRSYFDGWTIVFASEIKAFVQVGVPCGWREGLDVLAAMIRCRVKERPGKVLRVVPK